MDLTRLLDLSASYLALVIAGVLGGLTHMIVAPPDSKLRGLGILIVGGISAVYLAPFATRVLPFIPADDPEVVSGFAFFFGLTGVLIAEITTRTFKGLRDGEGFSDAIRRALIRVLTNGESK